jgi:hypothetical protein
VVLARDTWGPQHSDFGDKMALIFTEINTALTSFVNEVHMLTCVS